VETAINNISDFTRDGYRLGGLGQLNTTWRDDGETLFGYNYYPLLWGAECAWAPVAEESGAGSHEQRERRVAQFDNAFDGVFYGLSGSAIAKANHQLGSVIRQNPLAGNMIDTAVWKESVAAWSEAGAAENAAKLMADSAEVIQTASDALRSARYNADTLKEMIFAAKRVRFVGMKVMAVEGLARHPDNRVTHMNGAYVRDLIAALTSLREEFVNLWNAENRAWWLDKNLAKYDEMIASLRQLPAQIAFTPARVEFSGSLDVRLWGLAGGAVHYTVDGSEPTEQSPLFTRPISLTKTTTIKARQVLPDGKLGSTFETTYSVLRLPAKIVTRMRPHEEHVANYAFDGSDNSFFWSDRAPKTGATFSVVLNTPTAFHRLAARTGHPTLHRDQLKQGVLEISFDGKAFQQVAEFKDGAAQADLPNKPIKAVRIRVTGDQEEWLAVREIELN
jgi:hypothetical protein